MKKADGPLIVAIFYSHREGIHPGLSPLHMNTIVIYSTQAKYDAFRRRYPLAYMKRDVHKYELLPFHTEILIIGGGLTGSSIAYWLKEDQPWEEMTITVIENTEKVLFYCSCMLFAENYILVCQKSINARERCNHTAIFYTRNG